MANNRLFLYDPSDGEHFCLAKSFSLGWQIWQPETISQRLQDWLDGRDAPAVYGAINEPTTLQLLTEGDLPEPSQLASASMPSDPR